MSTDAIERNAARRAAAPRDAAGRDRSAGGTGTPGAPADGPGRAAPPQRIDLVAADGHRIVAMRYAPDAAPRARIVVAGATGVPQGFYRRFAEHARARGIETLTLDYRGIGLSAPPSLRGFHVDYLDWARQDLAAAIDAVPRDDVPLHVVGHSYGGHAFGLLPNHARVARFATFATGAGWHGWMPRAERLRVTAMWRVIGPVWTRAAGYLPWSRLGMGEDLPLSVYRQWRHWCRFPNYFFDDPEVAGEMRERFSAVRTPILAVNATDDGWAPPRSRDAFMRGYAGTRWQGLDLEPRGLGLRSIGHMGYFRTDASRLWDATLAWFDAPSPETGAFTAALGRHAHA